MLKQARKPKHPTLPKSPKTSKTGLFSRFFPFPNPNPIHQYPQYPHATAIYEPQLWYVGPCCNFFIVFLIFATQVTKKIVPLSQLSSASPYCVNCRTTKLNLIKKKKKKIILQFSLQLVGTQWPVTAF